MSTPANCSIRRCSDNGARFSDALDLGLDDSDRLQRAVRGLYLSRLGLEDARDRQRDILDALDSWVEELGSAGRCAGIQPDEVAGKVEVIRRGLDLGNSGGGPPGGFGSEGGEPEDSVVDGDEAESHPWENGWNGDEPDAR